MSFNKLTGAILIALASQAANASGFALIEQSASGQGLSYAGAAANAEDASVMWFNPAGLTDIEGSQVVAGAHIISPKTKFSNNASTPIGGVANDDGGVNGLVPNLYWKGEYAGYALGLGVNAPFGSKVEYADDWIGRIQAIKTDLKTYNFNLNGAKKLSDSISVGVGLNVQKVDLNMTQSTGVSFASPLGVVKADSWGFGYNLGLMAKLSESTDLGISYRSEIKHAAKGTFEVGGVSLGDIESDVTLPATAIVSLSHQLNEKTKILAGATWTGWKAYDELVITGALNKSTDQNFKDSMRYSLGFMHRLNNKWNLRAGVAKDLTPVPNAESRTPRTPDTDKTWLSAGFNYKLSNTMALDFGYSKILGDSAEINKVDNTLLNGTYDTSVDILSAQLVWNY